MANNLKIWTMPAGEGGATMTGCLLRWGCRVSGKLLAQCHSEETEKPRIRHQHSFDKSSESFDIFEWIKSGRMPWTVEDKQNVLRAHEQPVIESAGALVSWLEGFAGCFQNDSKRSQKTPIQ